MNLSDIFPLKVGTPLKKRDINILFAALFERKIKRTAFSVANFANPAFSSPTDVNLEAILTSDSSVTGWRAFLLYEDLFQNDFQCHENSISPIVSLRRIYWTVDNAIAAPYDNHDVIFSIKDFSLYFKEGGGWVKDTGQIIISNSDTIIIRLLTLANNLRPARVIFDDTTTIDPTDLLDLGYYLKHEAPSSFGTYPVSGEDLPDGLSLTRRVLTCDSVETFVAPKTLSPYLIYTNPITSSIYIANNETVYVRNIISNITTSNINKNFLFTASLAQVPEDYYLDFFGGANPVVAYKEASLFLKKANLTASVMNFLYYIVSFSRFFRDSAFAASTLSPGTATVTSPLASYFRFASTHSTVIGVYPVFVTNSCGFGSGGSSTTTAANGDTSTVTISTSFGIWSQTTNEVFALPFPIFEVWSRTTMRLHIDMDTTLEIKG